MTNNWTIKEHAVRQKKEFFISFTVFAHNLNKFACKCFCLMTVSVLFVMEKKRQAIVAQWTTWCALDDNSKHQPQCLCTKFIHKNQVSVFLLLFHSNLKFLTCANENSMKNIAKSKKFSQHFSYCACSFILSRCLFKYHHLSL